MRTKNLMLGILALTFASGSALASLLVVPPDYIHVKPTATSEWTCIIANCTNAGVACTARVNRTKPGGGIGTTPVYETLVDSETCQTQVLGVRASTLPPIEVYDAD